MTTFWKRAAYVLFFVSIYSFGCFLFGFRGIVPVPGRCFLLLFVKLTLKPLT